MFTVCEQPLLPPACSVAWSPLGLRLWVRALWVRGVFYTPPLPVSAPLSGAEDFFWLGGHPGHGCFAGRDTPPAHQRFGRGDENYLVGEPVVHRYKEDANLTWRIAIGSLVSGKSKI